MKFILKSVMFLQAFILLLPLTLAAQELDCDKNNFDNFLINFQNLSKEQQIKKITLPIVYINLDYGSDAQETELITKEDLKTWDAIIGKREVYQESGWDLKTEKITEEDYVVTAYDACTNCASIYTKYFFKWKDNCWKLDHMEAVVFN